MSMIPEICKKPERDFMLRAVMEILAWSHVLVGLDSPSTLLT